MNGLAWLVPWEFSPTFLLVFAATVLLYLRGSRRRPRGFWRQLSFWSGLVLLYAALQTEWDYYAEREFFVHRLQHVVLHHLAPFLIMLAAPGPTIRTGLPLRWRAFLRKRVAPNPIVRFALGVLLNPGVAGFLFVGVIYLWLWPPLHFVAMLDWRLYRVMNWSVTIDGLLFWWLVLDRRSKPPARLAPGTRIFLSLIVAVPQIILGAYIALTSRDLFPIYDLCGRAFPWITTMRSQRIGGLILWIPGGMMSVLGALVAIRNWTSLSSRGRLAAPSRVRARRLRSV